MTEHGTAAIRGQQSATLPGTVGLPDPRQNSTPSFGAPQAFQLFEGDPVTGVINPYQFPAGAGYCEICIFGTAPMTFGLPIYGGPPVPLGQPGSLRIGQIQLPPAANGLVAQNQAVDVLVGKDEVPKRGAMGAFRPLADDSDDSFIMYALAGTEALPIPQQPGYDPAQPQPAEVVIPIFLDAGAYTQALADLNDRVTYAPGVFFADTSATFVVIGVFQYEAAV